MSDHPFKAKILAMRGKKSFGLIARELGISRCAVAGVCFRHDHPKQRSIGTGAYITPPARWPVKNVIKRGENHYASKLTEVDIIDIRARPKPRNISELAREFDVSRQTIFSIVHGYTWKHVR